MRITKKNNNGKSTQFCNPVKENFSFGLLVDLQCLRLYLKGILEKETRMFYRYKICWAIFYILMLGKVTEIDPQVAILHRILDIMVSLWC